MSANNLDVAAARRGGAGVGKKRLRVEALLAATALPSPPPQAAAPPLAAWLPALLPDPSLSELLPAGDPVLGRRLAVLPQADVYLQDEVQLALHPTLTRLWCPKGRRGQRLVQAPRVNAKRWGFGLVDWRDGWIDWVLDEHRAAAPFCAQLRRAVERSQARGRTAVVILNSLGIHTVRHSKVLQALLAEVKDHLLLVYPPAYDPEANRIEWLWRELRRAVTHNHQRRTLDELLADASAWATGLTAAEVLQHLGSPFAATAPPPEEEHDAA
jgi:transposase